MILIHFLDQTFLENQWKELEKKMFKFLQGLQYNLVKILFSKLNLGRIFEMKISETKYVLLHFKFDEVQVCSFRAHFIFPTFLRHNDSIEISDELFPAINFCILYLLKLSFFNEERGQWVHWAPKISSKIWTIRAKFGEKGQKGAFSRCLLS